ncbi:ATP-binding protein [Streptomyces sp. VRA16 Mangrove soil]|uniref:ATP-binding protein n=1 Tax=Streptomyces sp. VRA16 Mangrove soil TaxID=2817434 RepID=UPI001A9D159E|nr:ATP-binding protein [Streptomyces sp. VRA16 Mangrove soil]MBO1330967.1 ATP-binding protein [Streptomyces sp. VRA16 Mangrove soil]
MNSATRTPGAESQLQSVATSFTVTLSSATRAARLARTLATAHLADRGIAPTEPVSRAVAAVVAELAANAVTHGRTPGRDFRLTLMLLPGHIRVEVTDTRPDRRPELQLDAGSTESGRGLLLVAAHTRAWGCVTRDAYTKTVWAEIATATPPETL